MLANKILEEYIVNPEEERELDKVAFEEVDKDSLSIKVEKSKCEIIDLNEYRKGDFYLNNESLLKANKELQYTSEQIKELKHCKNNIFDFLINHTKIIHLEYGRIPFSLRDYQQELIEKMQKHNRLLNLQSRQSGKTTAFAGFILHYVIFNPFKTVAILANKGQTARDILHKIKEMYMQLPLWFQPGIRIWNKGSIELGNGSTIIAESTSGSASRGKAINILYIDEAAFIQKNTWDDFWSSVYPTVSSSKTSKIFMSTTPWGMNHFYKLWKDAKSGTNGFATHEVGWERVPGRDEEWKMQTIKELTREKFDAEYDLKFLGSAGTLISGYQLSTLAHQIPLEERFDYKFKIYKYPEPERQYITICDYAEGIGEDSSTIHVIDVTEQIFEQVAVYKDNTIKIKNFSAVKNRIGKYYNTALIIGENNSIGNDCLEQLNDDYEYENIFLGDDKGEKFGIRMTKTSKRLGCSELKTLIEDKKLIINDFDTIDELSNFVRKASSYEADSGHHDDLVTPLVLFAYFIDNKEWVEEWLDKTINSNNRLINKIEEDLLPIGFLFDGVNIESLNPINEF